MILKLAKLLFVLILLAGCQHAGEISNNFESIEQQKLTVAAVQYRIEGNLTEKSALRKIERYLKEAKGNNADLVVFPELINLDRWPLGSSARDRKIVKKLSQNAAFFVKDVSDLAKKYKMNIVFGSITVIDDNKIKNRSFFITDQGDYQWQDKLTFTPWGKKVGFKSGKKIEGIQTPWGRMVILICYDAESPTISNYIAKKIGPVDLIVIPSMTESEEGFRRVQYSAKARAVEHHAYVVVAGTVGQPEEDWTNIGQGAFFGPQYPGYPDVIKVGEKNKEGLVIKTLDFQQLRKTKAENQFYPAQEKISL